MKLLGHLVRADVRRFRLLLAGWVLIEVLNTIFTGVRPLLAFDPRMLTAVELLRTVLFLTRWLGMIVIAALVVQTHPLVGSDAFWMTRPIPPRALFASKIVLLGATFVVVPAVCEAVLMAACRFPIADSVLVALQTMLFQSLWLALAMALSATTRNLARFVLVVGGVLVSFVLLISITMAVLMRSMSDGPQWSAVTNRSVPSPTAGVVMLLLLIAAPAVLLAIQYRTRSTRFSVSAGVAAVAVAVLIGVKWPSQGQPLAVPEWARREAALRLNAQSPKGEFRPLETWSHRNPAEGWQMGAARLRLSGVEGGWTATVRLADSNVQFDDGATLATAGNGYQASVPFEGVDDSPDRIVLRHVLGVSRVSGRSHWFFRAEAMPAIVVSQSNFKKYSASSGTYRGSFLMDLDRIEIAATLPLQAGAEYDDRGVRVVIDRVIPQTDAASIGVRQFTASTMFVSGALPSLSFFLRNLGAAEAVAGSPHGIGGVSAGLALPFMFGFGVSSPGSGSGFTATGQYIRFPEGYRPDEEAVDISADWLSHAELVIVRTVPAGSVTRTVEIPGFEIRAAPPATPGLPFR
jgi:hypothetical protein